MELVPTHGPLYQWKYPVVQYPSCRPKHYWQYPVVLVPPRVSLYQ